MRCLLSLSLAILLAGCGLTHGDTTVSHASPVAPLHDVDASSGSFFSVIPESDVETESSAMEAEMSGPTGGTGRVAQGAASWVELGGALQPKQDADAVDADAEEVEVEEWDVRLSPYFWLPKISGTAIVNGLGGRTKITQGQIWRNLDSALLVNLHAVKGDTVFRLDTIGFAISDEANIGGIPSGKITGRLELMLIELDAGVRVVDEKEEKVDVFVGARYVYIKARINPKNIGVQGQSGSVDWVDPVIGSRYQRELSDDWSMFILGDYGGFGVGSASDTTYQLTSLAEYNGGGHWSFGAGYRYLVFDHSSGNGASRNEQHLRFSGPILGATYRF